MTKSSEGPADRDDNRQVSEGGSSFSNAEAAAGGADAVPDTPDVTSPEGGAGLEPSVPDAASDRDMTKDADERPDS